MATKYRVISIKGTNPELFIIVGIDFDEHSVKSTSQAMGEADLRAHLREAGASPDETTAWIEQGRAYPD